MKSTNAIIGLAIIGGLMYASSQNRFQPMTLAQQVARAKETIIERNDNIDNLDSVRDIQSGVDYINENLSNSVRPSKHIIVKAHGTAEQQRKALNRFVGEFAEEHGGSVSLGMSSTEIMNVRDANRTQGIKDKQELKRTGKLSAFDKLLAEGESFFKRLPITVGRERNDQQRRARSFVKRLRKQVDNLSSAIRSKSRDRRAQLNNRLQETDALLNRTMLQAQLKREADLTRETLSAENAVSVRLSELFQSRF